MADVQWETGLSVDNLEFITDTDVINLELGATWDIIDTQIVRVTATRLEDGVEIEVTDVGGTTTGIVYDGHTPVKGVDYFTQEDIADFEADVISDLRTTYIHEQLTATASWSIAHNLGKFPSVTIVDSGGSVVVGEVRYLDENTVSVVFAAPFSGRAYLN